ncbi:hypothetical protein B0F90DRAFT_1756991, partial [Multifurca ochricompacta]
PWSTVLTGSISHPFSDNSHVSIYGFTAVWYHQYRLRRGHPVTPVAHDNQESIL